MKPLMRLSIFVLATVAVIGWWLLDNHQGDVVSPARGTVVQAVYATGEVEPVYWVKLSPNIAGQIISVWVDDNDAVTRDTILAQLDDTVEGAKLVEYQSRLEFLRQEKERYQTLVKNNAASHRQLQQVQSDYAVVAAQIDAQAKYIQRMHIVAPMDGVILKRDVEPGESVMLDDTIFWIGQTTPLRITAEVDEEDIALIQPGQTALIKADAFPDREIEGIIDEITLKGDPVDKNFRVRISLPEETPLMIGMTVEVNVIANIVADALTLPLESVIEEAVWVKDGSDFVKRVIQIGIADEQRVQILSGVDETDEILATPPKDDSE